MAFTLEPDDSFSKVYERLVRQAFPSEIEAVTKKLTDATAKKKAVKRFIDSLQAEVEWTHRHYVKDDEYIPYGENIEEFLKREIAKPIIRWEDSPQLGYEILPNKYFYRYQPPTPAKDLLAEFWKLEKEAEKMLEGLFGEGNVNQHVCIIRPSAGLDYRFLAYCLTAPWGQDQILSSFTGASRQGLGQRDLGGIQIPLPPLNEQERIAAYLDASCAQIDSAVAVKRRQLETLNQLRRVTIHNAVTRGVNFTTRTRNSGVEWFEKIPEHWNCEHLKRFATRIQTGSTPPTDRPDYYLDGTIPWFAPGSYDGDIELREPRKLVNESAKHDGTLRTFPPGAVFLVGIGATIGKVGLIKESASCNQQIIGIVCNYRMTGRYLAYQFKIYEDVIPGIAAATTLPIFDQVKTGYLPTLQPPVEEQQAICAFLDNKLAEVKSIVTAINLQIKTLIAYRKSLIHECVTGQRRVTEADLKRVGVSF